MKTRTRNLKIAAAALPLVQAGVDVMPEAAYGGMPQPGGYGSTGGNAAYQGVGGGQADPYAYKKNQYARNNYNQPPSAAYTGAGVPQPSAAYGGAPPQQNQQNQQQQPNAGAGAGGNAAYGGVGGIQDMLKQGGMGDFDINKMMKNMGGQGGQGGMDFMKKAQDMLKNNPDMMNKAQDFMKQPGAMDNIQKMMGNLNLGDKDGKGGIGDIMKNIGKIFGKKDEEGNKAGFDFDDLDEWGDLDKMKDDMWKGWKDIERKPSGTAVDTVKPKNFEQWKTDKFHTSQAEESWFKVEPELIINRTPGRMTAHHEWVHNIPDSYTIYRGNTVVKFWMDGCPWCEKIEGFFQEAAQKLQNTRFGKDVDILEFCGTPTKDHTRTPGKENMPRKGGMAHDDADGHKEYELLELYGVEYFPRIIWTWKEGHNKSGKTQYEAYNSNFESTEDVLQWIVLQKFYDCTLRNPDMSKLSALYADKETVHNLLNLKNDRDRAIAFNESFDQVVAEVQADVDAAAADAKYQNRPLSMPEVDKRAILDLLLQIKNGAEEVVIDPLVAIDAKRFHEINNANKPLMVMIHAPHCPACEDAMPKMKELGRALHDNSVIIAKMNVADSHHPDNRAISDQLGVKAVPSFFFFNIPKERLAEVPMEDKREFKAHSGTLLLNSKGNNKLGDPCPICHEAMYEHGVDGLVRTHCGHAFHRECMSTALQHDDRCPMCRGTARPLEVEYNYNVPYLEYKNAPEIDNWAAWIHKFFGVDVEQHMLEYNHAAKKDIKPRFEGNCKLRRWGSEIDSACEKAQSQEMEL